MPTLKRPWAIGIPLAKIEYLFYYDTAVAKPIGGSDISTRGFGSGRLPRPPQEFALTRYIMRGCPRCGGDLHINEQYYRKDDWQCLQCGRYQHRPDPRPRPYPHPRPAGHGQQRDLPE